MSILLTCQAISKSFGTRNLFDNLSFSVSQNDRLGVIGPNGVGKSTLMKVLAGLESVDDGEVTCRKYLKVGYVAQSCDFAGHLSVLEVMTESCLKAGIHSDEAETAAYIQLSLLGFEQYDQKVETLSGGWKKRLAIGTGTLGDPDLVLFDEPTNHLDLDGLKWLEGFLLQASFAWVMISHDRFLLNHTASKVVEINRCFKNFTLMTSGGYDAHLKHREEFLAGQQQVVDSLSSKIRREDEWLKRGPKARTTKAKFRVDNAHELHKQLSEVQNRLKTKQTEIEFSSSQRKTKKLVTLEDVSLQLGDKQLIKDFSYVFTSKKFVGLVGGNGTGKSSFLKMMQGLITPNSGSVKQANDLKVVYFEQERNQIDLSLSLKRALSEHGDSVIFGDRSIHIHSWARKFGFEYDQLDTPLQKLSGGERARVLIARLMLQPADILLLDEPTNDLDIFTLEVLEESLSDFSGSIVLVTHDRYMLKRLCDTYLHLDGKGKLTSYADPFQWERELEAQAKNKQDGSAGKPKQTSSKNSNRDKKNSLTFAEKKELSSIEEQVLKVEEQMERLVTESQQNSGLQDQQYLRELGEKMSSTQQEIDRLYDRWADLEQKSNIS